MLNRETRRDKVPDKGSGLPQAESSTAIPVHELAWNRYEPARVCVVWPVVASVGPTERFGDVVGGRWEKAAEEFEDHLTSLAEASILLADERHASSGADVTSAPAPSLSEAARATAARIRERLALSTPSVPPDAPSSRDTHTRRIPDAPAPGTETPSRPHLEPPSDPSATRGAARLPVAPGAGRLVAYRVPLAREAAPVARRVFHPGSERTLESPPPEAARNGGRRAPAPGDPERFVLPAPAVDASSAALPDALWREFRRREEALREWEATGF